MSQRLNQKMSNAKQLLTHIFVNKYRRGKFYSKEGNSDCLFAKALMC